MEELDVPQMRREVESLQYQLAINREKSSITVTDLGQMMSRRSVRTSRDRLRWLILVLMHAGMSANMADSAFLLLSSREEAWRGHTHLSC
ncbi:Guanine nucleotide-binding protein G(I)/G(S)/G(O) subunit gamma-13 [Liparis tanakae]|uniref:Guanine nucleotide-binding protein G(I)/G(S)/G(O) subunit gamma-13 n=1 Tax=Liparis tanakae TaxID=230148 RepID=A0A4Z2J868_9TELE|nr:Guanine nucleotide-binding protein G(I)/G(S)/G(O) subunit gamma-13 [Liparis tanakae]